jgi:hypothetical protein
MSKYLGFSAKSTSEMPKLDKLYGTVKEFASKYKSFIVVDADNNDFTDIVPYEKKTILYFVTSTEANYTANKNHEDMIWVYCESYQKATIMKCLLIKIQEQRIKTYFVCNNIITLQSICYALKSHGKEEPTVSKDGTFSEKLLMTFKTDINDYCNNMSSKGDKVSGNIDPVYYNSNKKYTYFIHKLDSYNVYTIKNFNRTEVILALRTNSENKPIDTYTSDDLTLINNFNNLLIDDGRLDLKIKL